MNDAKNERKVEINSTYKKEYKIPAIREKTTLTEMMLIKEYNEIRFVVVDENKSQNFIDMCKENNLSEADYFEVFFSDKAESVYINKENLRSLLDSLLVGVVNTRKPIEPSNRIVQEGV